ncbi:hypothetical protein KIN20_017415 [Parelaphostrongylus tenuis]|uniref:Uncharacterized protein n=1 Tax=Parelaphostrongylus tenuis TaxID=148309 RepID=A0AAD5MLH3_PARTN|nr:hypothetical protein KIN20_017415 [Parelaphostrongylus tenuis]
MIDAQQKHWHTQKDKSINKKCNDNAYEERQMSAAARLSALRAIAVCSGAATMSSTLGSIELLCDTAAVRSGASTMASPLISAITFPRHEKLENKESVTNPPDLHRLSH